ncbi:E3 ubiquitin-protein ligase rad18 [Cytospora paraplurivora]|uniref:E3 ubiquitin-protein ligase rad18 n=1 Tax=Cytospora paraplurivora TaxID=2898453 RepID=A0AAN9USR6_9PEZI
MDARITGPITKDDAYDVSDPTDWLGTPLASLMPAVEHFTKGREAMLKLAREPPALATAAPASTPKRKAADESDNALKKRLSDLGISSWGPRPLLERRHREWVMIWNANCDSSRPKTKSELLQDLNIWERTQGGSASLTSHSANLGAQIKDKEFDGAGWSTKHSDSFKDLIANARMTRRKAEQKTQEPPPTDGQHITGTSSNNTCYEPPPEVLPNGVAQSEIQTLTSSETAIDLTIPSSQPQETDQPQKPLAERTTTSLVEDTVVDLVLQGRQNVHDSTPTKSFTP